MALGRDLRRGVRVPQTVSSLAECPLQHLPRWGLHSLALPPTPCPICEALHCSRERPLTSPSVRLCSFRLHCHSCLAWIFSASLSDLPSHPLFSELHHYVSFFAFLWLLFLGFTGLSLMVLLVTEDTFSEHTLPTRNSVGFLHRLTANGNSRIQWRTME